jgi:hypothetical protein
VQTSGTHTWFTAPSNSSGAGAAMSGRTQVMTLDASGNLGVGTTSPNISAGSSGSQVLTVSASASARNALIELKGTRTSADQVSSYIRSFSNSATTPGVDLQFYRGAADTDGFLTISTSGTERARIDSSGNLLVGTTSTGQGTKLVVKGAGDVWSYGPDNSGGTTFYVINNSGVGVGLSTGNTSWSAISDERLKNIKEPITNAVEKLSTLRSVYGNYKTDSDDVSRLFLIAQDVQKVFPEVIDTAEDELKTLSLRSTDLIPVLVKAIQEQQAMIESLKARLDAANL